MRVLRLPEYPHWATIDFFAFSQLRSGIALQKMAKELGHKLNTLENL